MYELQVGSFPNQVSVCNRTMRWWSPSSQVRPLYLAFVLTSSIQVYSLLALGSLCHASPSCLHGPTALYWRLHNVVWKGLQDQHLTLSRPHTWQETLVPGCTSWGRVHAVVSVNLAHQFALPWRSPFCFLDTLPFRSTCFAEGLGWTGLPRALRRLCLLSACPRWPGCETELFCAAQGTKDTILPSCQPPDSYLSALKATSCPTGIPPETPGRSWVWDGLPEALPSFEA